MALFKTVAPAAQVLGGRARASRLQSGDAIGARELPNGLVRLAARRNPTARVVVPYLGVVRETSSEKARRVLGWAPGSFEEAVVATAESVLRLGLS